jgi:hypothetical protein
MAVTKEQARKVRQPVHTGDLSLSIALDGTTTIDTRILSIVAEKVSWQSDASLAGTIEFSINGTDFFGSVVFAATVPGSYSTHLIRAIKITRTGGAGKLHLLAK